MTSPLHYWISQSSFVFTIYRFIGFVTAVRFRFLHFIANKKARRQKDQICYYHFCFTQTILITSAEIANISDLPGKHFSKYDLCYKFSFCPLLRLDIFPRYLTIFSLQQLIRCWVRASQDVWLLSQFMNARSDYKLWSRDASSGPVERGSQVLMISFSVSGTHSAPILIDKVTLIRT